MIHHRDITGGVRHVDIGAEKINGRSGGLPDVQHVVGRTTAFVTGRAGIAKGRTQRDVNIHGQRVFGVAGCGHLADVMGRAVGAKNSSASSPKTSRQLPLSLLAPFLPPSAFKNSAGTGAANIFSASGE